MSDGETAVSEGAFPTSGVSLPSWLTDPFDGAASRRRACTSCGKPLGSTTKKCHDCGGRSRRGGDRIQAREWQVLLGVGGSSGGDDA
jgi:hypothetical protein